MVLGDFVPVNSRKCEVGTRPRLFGHLWLWSVTFDDVDSSLIARRRKALLSAERSEARMRRSGASKDMKAMVVVGHPSAGSFNYAIADTIRRTWTVMGCDVAFHDLVEEGFEPLLTAAEARGAPSSDQLVRTHIAQLQACDLLAVVHPNCWGAPPAIVKGWIDRVFAPNAAYAFAKGDDQGDKPVGLLKAKVALVINTGNTPPEREESDFGDPLDRMWRDCILSYCGVKHVIRSLFGVVATSSVDERDRWLAETATLASDAVVRASEDAGL